MENKFVFLEVPAKHTLSGMGISSLQKDGKGTKIIIIPFSWLEPGWSILIKESM